MVLPSNTPERISTTSPSCRAVVNLLCPGFLLFKYAWISASSRGRPAGHPSTTTPTPFPWDSPQADTLNTVSYTHLGNQAPFDFDVSVKDIYSTLKTGASMEIIPKRLFSIPTGLLDYLCDRKITTAIWAVSALCIITTLNGFTYRVPEHLDVYKRQPCGSPRTG